MRKKGIRFILQLSLIFLMSLSVSVWAERPPLADTDNDGLPDAWEIKYSKGDLSLLDKDSDYDEDGISNGVEYQIGSDPTTASPIGPRITYQYDKLGRLIKIERIPSK